MRRRCAVLMLLAVCGAPALLAPAAAAGLVPVPLKRPIVTTPATPLPVSAPVVKTAAMLSGAAYPWVQPIWMPVGQTFRLTLGLAPAGEWTQPPAWIRIIA